MVRTVSPATLSSMSPLYQPPLGSYLLGLKYDYDAQ